MKKINRKEQKSPYNYRFNLALKLTVIIFGITINSMRADNKKANNKLEVLNIQQIQQIQVKGTVRDTDGMPIPGANVMIKGTTTGTTTDIDGNYILAVQGVGQTLVFSYLGLKSLEIKINGKMVVNAILTNDAAALEEVVVVGYGTVRKSDLTGSVSSADTKELNKTQNTNLAQAIQGRMAGVSVTKGSGGPGSTPTVRIRGIGTVNGADPLYVVDGVPINDISSINMADAKSVEVLKDASATAIYGSRGANGVVLITTNGGTKGKTVITYKTYVGVENRIDNLDVLNSQQWATLYNEGNANDGKPADPALANPSALPNYNWKDAIYKSGQMQSHQLAVSGGTDKTTYYASFGYINQTGILQNSSYKRTNFRVNNTYQIMPKIKVGHNIQYSNSNTNSVPSFGPDSFTKSAFVGYMIDPVSPIYNADGSYGQPKYVSSLAVNPLGLVQFGQSPNTKESFLGNVFLEIEIIKGLTFKSNYGLQINDSKVDNFKPAYNVSPSYNSPVSTYYLQRNEDRVLIMSNTLNYNTTFSKKHNFTALLGQEIQDLSSNNVTAQRNQIPESVANPTLGSGAVSTSTNGGGISNSKLLSFFGRINYNYDDRYLLTGTYRLDGSSRFGSNNRWAQFPSLALAWNIHNEKFFHANAINQFKFRVGWGETGNQNIPNSSTFNTLNIGNNYPFGDSKNTGLGVAPLQPGNQNLKWETTKTSNIGLDLAFLHNSVTFSADYFIKNTSDMLMPTPILGISGYSQNPYTNAGNIRNKGVELTANYKKVIKDFSFSLGGNISFIQNKVLSLNGEGSLIQTGSANALYNISRTVAGQPLASFYGYQMEGIFQNQSEVNSSAILPNTKPGDVKYKDLNGDGVINDNDKTFIGSAFPKYTYGINLDMTYKQFDFTAFFQGSQGNKIFNSTDRWLEADLASNSNTNALNRWTGEGTSNSVPRATFDNSGNNAQISSRFVKDGSYLRLKNVQIGYTLPDSILDKIAISKLRLYVSGQNLLTFTKYDGLDPEVGVDNTQNSPLDIGIDRGRYPSVRTISLGLDVNF
ncbi:SusC/RagA family TonB-linked outer membrane protein [Flavobacterium faecale]|uniref:SusC/RagA family TonB-linked outer membrane protein n=1 Tax=Flavobacterium faecale TaxID=1355330 RepID=A0A2S1LHN4_9FLAO|nr:TonB-dependent receptor [Flavobacterium faecale]AWG23305.1 SusC/RagA family TonB-linked outer membrane protein [Flavobacterium faecale]